MSEEKKERMRKVMEELKNAVNVGPVAPESVICQEAMRECLKLKWVGKDENGNFVPTNVGRALFGR